MSVKMSFVFFVTNILYTIGIWIHSQWPKFLPLLWQLCDHSSYSDGIVDFHGNFVPLSKRAAWRQIHIGSNAAQILFIPATGFFGARRQDPYGMLLWLISLHPELLPSFFYLQLFHHMQWSCICIIHIKMMIKSSPQIIDLCPSYTLTHCSILCQHGRKDFQMIYCWN